MLIKSLKFKTLIHTYISTYQYYKDVDSITLYYLLPHSISVSDVRFKVISPSISAVFLYVSDVINAAVHPNTTTFTRKTNMISLQNVTKMLQKVLN